jgi:hypothetical protein
VVRFIGYVALVDPSESNWTLCETTLPLHIVHWQLLSVCYRGDFGEEGMVGEWVRAIFPWEILNSTPRNWSGRKETALKVWGGKINHLGEKLCSTNTFWVITYLFCMYDHHQYIISLHIVKDVVVVFSEAFFIYPWMASYREENPGRNK